MLAALKPDGEPVVSEAGPPERRFSITSNFVTRRSQDNRRAMYPMIVRYITARGARNFQFLLRPLPNPDVPIMTNYMLVIRDHVFSTKQKMEPARRSSWILRAALYCWRAMDPEESLLTRSRSPSRFLIANTNRSTCVGRETRQREEKLAEDLGKVVGDQTLEDFWGHFHAPVQVKELVFALATEENLAMMRAFRIKK